MLYLLYVLQSANVWRPESLPISLIFAFPWYLNMDSQMTSYTMFRFAVSRTRNSKFPVRERDGKIVRENGKSRFPQCNAYYQCLPISIFVLCSTAYWYLHSSLQVVHLHHALSRHAHTAHNHQNGRSIGSLRDIKQVLKIKTQLCYSKIISVCLDA